jgi:DNA-binding FadR family transcriptional regulator
MRSMGVALADEPMRKRVWQEHIEILQFILEGRANEAEQAARRHTARAGEETALRLERLGRT